MQTYTKNTNTYLKILNTNNTINYKITKKKIQKQNTNIYKKYNKLKQIVKLRITKKIQSDTKIQTYIYTKNNKNNKTYKQIQKYKY